MDGAHARSAGTGRLGGPGVGTGHAADADRADHVSMGNSYIGVELGSVWNRLGSEVIVLEFYALGTLCGRSNDQSFV